MSKCDFCGGELTSPTTLTNKGWFHWDCWNWVQQIGYGWKRFKQFLTDNPND